MWLSIMGMYEYDPSVFDGFDPPSYTDQDNVVHVLNKDYIINSICLECAELELLYPSVEMMKFAIGVWSASNYDAFCKMYSTQLIKYNPIWNVDAIETENETNERDIGRIHTGANNEKRNLTDNETHNKTDTESVQGFNSNSWSESKKVVGTGTDTATFKETDNISVTNNETVNDDNKRLNTKRRTGNIGVTASQDLIKKEREIADFSTIDFIVKSFKKRFCLLIY